MKPIKKKVLVVDDTADIGNLLALLFRERGCETFLATDGGEAIDQAAKHVPDLILMDIQLQGMDGLEVTKLLKENPETRDIPVLAVTSYAMKGDREKALAVGCAGYITKPIDKTILLKQVANTLVETSTKV